MQVGLLRILSAANVGPEMRGFFETQKRGKRMSKISVDGDARLFDNEGRPREKSELQPGWELLVDAYKAGLDVLSGLGLARGLVEVITIRFFQLQVSHTHIPRPVLRVRFVVVFQVPGGDGTGEKKMSVEADFTDSEVQVAAPSVTSQILAKVSRRVREIEVCHKDLLSRISECFANVHAAVETENIPAP